jgi:hypothetical protein
MPNPDDTYECYSAVALIEGFPFIDEGATFETFREARQFIKELSPLHPKIEWAIDAQTPEGATDRLDLEGNP